MSQIMRLRRKAGSDHEIEDRNNGYRHEHAFVKNIRRNGLLHESDLLADSYGGKFHPRAAPELLGSLPTAVTALARGKMTPSKVLLHPHKASKEVKKLFDTIDGHAERVELNLYVVGYEDEPDEAPADQSPPTVVGGAEATTGPQDKSPTFPGPGEGAQSSSSESENP